MSKALTRHVYVADEAQEIKNVVVLLHGYGANGTDLLDLGRSWAPLLPNTIFISPDAPFSCDFGTMGFQWFSLQDYTPEAMEMGAAKAYPILKQFMDDIRKEYKVQKISVVGFSQGTMMSLYYGLRHGEDVDGILGYSGALMGATLKVLDTQKKLPVCLIHGAEDTVVPVDATEMACTQLKELGCDVEKMIVPDLEHGIDSSGLQKGGTFLQSL